MKREYLVYDRLRMRIYLAIAFAGTALGMIFGIGLEIELQFFLVIILLIFGVIGHFAWENVGYYIALSLDSIGIGILFTVILTEIGLTPIIGNILIAAVIVLAIYIALVYMANMVVYDASLYGLSIFVSLALYILFGILALDMDSHLFDLIYTLQHVGLFYFIAMWITGENTYDLLRNCSIASFSLLAIAAVVALIALSDGKLKLGGITASGSSARRTAHSHHHHHYHHRTSNWFLYSAMYDRNRYNNKRTVQYNVENQEVYPENQSVKDKEIYVDSTKNKEKKKDYDENEWDL